MQSLLMSPISVSNHILARLVCTLAHLQATFHASFGVFDPEV